MKILMVSAMLLCASATAANAESFTLSGSGKLVQQVIVPVAGAPQPVGGQYGVSTFTTTLASGKKMAAKAECMSWTTAPGTQFSGEGACTDTDSEGTWSTAFSCQGDAKSGIGDCWGRLTGMTGSYANKVGTVSWHSTNGDGGKTLAFAGTGMWN